MKKSIFFVLVIIFSLSASTAFASKTDPTNSTDKMPVPNKTENKLSEEELSRLTKRAEEIHDMDKTNMTVNEKRDLKKESKSIKNKVRSGGVIYISGGTILLIILILILV